MKTVVITGCLGMIGSAITELCISLGWEVYGVDSQTYASNPNLLSEWQKKKNFTYEKADIAELKSIPDCDYVINTAAETHVGNSIIDSNNFMRTNVLGVQNLLNILKDKPENVCSRPVLLHFSTDEVYGDINDGFHTENDLLKPSNPYSASKAAADMLIQAWSRTYGLNYLIMRPTNNYGPNQYPEKLIPLTVKLLQRNKKIRLHNEGKPIRTWLHSHDTARAVVTVIQAGVTNGIYNISGNIELPNIETVKLVIDAYYMQLRQTRPHYNQLLDLSFVRQGQDVRYAISDSKLKSLGWKAEKNFVEEVPRLVQHYRQNFRW